MSTIEIENVDYGCLGDHNGIFGRCLYVRKETEVAHSVSKS